MRKRVPAEPVVFLRLKIPPDGVGEATRAIRKGKGKVLDSGYGTAKDPSCAWFEVKVPEGAKVVDVVKATYTVEEAVPADRGEGRLLARQLDLLGGIA